MTIAQYEELRVKAERAKSEAVVLRDLYETATCGLPMKYTGVHYGTSEVPPRIAARVADLYLAWAEEYEELANHYEIQMARMLEKEN